MRKSTAGVALMAVLWLGACGGGGSSLQTPPAGATITGVTISPASVSLEVGQTQPFTATVRGTGTFDPRLRWWVNNIEGGNALVGTVTSSGLFTAPNAVPSPNIVQVRASSVADPTKYATASATMSPTSATGTGPTLQVNAEAARHPINPYIYGMNIYGMDADSEAFARELRLPIRRWGGNHTTRYNYTLDLTNAGADWYFTTVPNNNPDPLDSSEFNRHFEQDRRTESRTMCTVPLIGWTTRAKQTLCGFSVAKYGPQEKTNPYVPDCGNGIRPDGRTYVTGNDPRDTSVAVDEGFVEEWVSYLVERYGAASNQGVAIYSLDNEPMLWFGTHRDIHPQPTTYGEMREKTYAYAAAIKRADPTAEVAGPVLFGWRAFFCSARDWIAGWSTPPYRWDSNMVDRNAHGGIPFVEWYLQQMQDYERKQGVRILDYLDLHGYVIPDGLSFEPVGDAARQALRLQSTRAFWDPTFIVGGEINDAPRLIPRMREWVARNYPGTKLAITEYNFGGQEDINGALALADALGIFGREGLDLATIWDPPKPELPAAYAFRMYCNYDGQGSSFGDVSVSAASEDQSKLAIYAAQRSDDGGLTLMVINKVYVHLSARVELAGFSPAAAAHIYRYSAANLRAIVPEADEAVEPDGFTTVFPAMSITLIVIRSG